MRVLAGAVTLALGVSATAVSYAAPAPSAPAPHLGARLSVTPAVARIAYGTGVQLTARGSSGRTRWSASPRSLAKVSRRGLLMATKRPKAGTVRVTARSWGASAHVIVKVSTAPLRSLSGVPAAVTLGVGEQLTLAPVGRFAGFTEALGPWATYTAAPAGVVSVSRGVVTALGVGTATVRTAFHGVSVSTTVSVATGTPTSGVRVSTATPGYTDVDADGALDMGDVMRWRESVTNAGGATATGLVVTGSNGGASCPSTTLAPGTTVTCTSQHTLTEADVAAGSLTHAVTASVDSPAGRITSAPATVITAFDRMDLALRRGDPDLVTYSELVAKAKALGAGHVSLAGALLPGSPMSWNPGSQIYAGKGIASYAMGSQQVVVTSNHNYVGSGTGTAPLGLAGTAPGSPTRMAYFSADPFTSAGTAPPSSTVATVTDPGMSAFDTNLLSWLLGSVNVATSTAQVRLVNMSGSKTSGLEGGTRGWFAAHAPSMVLNANECNLPSSACLAGANLVVVGGSAAGGNTATIAAQVKAAYDAGVPVLFMGDYWADDTADAIAATFSMSVDDGLVYWDQRGLLGSTAADQLPGGQDAFQQITSPVLTTTFGDPLAVSDYQSCIDDQGNTDTFDSCSLGTAAFTRYRDALDTWRSLISAADESGTSWFSQPRTGDQDLIRALVLLADKLRTGPGASLRPGDTAPTLSYPVPTLTDPGALTRAMFADATTMTAWSGNQASADSGTLYCTRQGLVATPRTCPPPVWPGLGNHSLTLKATTNDEWQATGFDAKPGAPVTVRLTSDPGVKVWVRSFFQRTSTTKSTGTDGSHRSYYDRPQFVATDWVPVTTTPTTFTTPYGGPLYVRIAGSSATSGTSVPLSFGNAATHPTVLDMTDSAQIANFISTVDDGAYYADLGGSGFEAHLPVTAIKAALSDSGTAGRTWDYASHGGLTQFLSDFRDQYVFTIYKLAGLQLGPTTPLTSSDDPDVLAACQNLGFPCTDPTLNQRTVIQHINYDQHAACGDLCSGNPIDSDGYPSPAGWGENHELGHNLQRQQLNVAWVDTGANGTNAGAVDSWTNYRNRSQEVSNNIFPYHAAWNFYRNVHQGWGVTPTPPPGTPDTAALSGRAGDLDAFSIAQSIRQLQSSGGVLSAFDSSCTSHNSAGDTVATPTNIAIADAFWRDGGYAADEDLRLPFYFDIPLMMRGKTLADSGATVLHDGWGIWTLLYQAARGWSAATASSSTWTASAQGTYGMSDYAWTNTAVYGSGKNVGAMVGNDWLLIELSKITGYDWRPYFQLHGVLYTALANQQVIDNTPAGGYKSWNTTFAARGGQYPLANDSNIGTVDMTLPTAPWPGSYDNSTTTKSHVGFNPMLPVASGGCS